MKHELNIGDGAETADQAGVAAEDRVECEVTAECGLFKRGEHWPAGSTIDLDPDTAARFEAVGEVKIR